MQHKWHLAICIIFIFNCLSIGNSFANNIITYDAPINLPPITADTTPPATENIDSKGSHKKSTNDKSLDDEIRSTEQYLYESDLKMLAVKYGLLKEDWPLKFPRKALAEKRKLDKNESEILTISTRTLLSLNAQDFEYDFPEVYALWAKNADLMHEVESAGLYTPPADLLNALNAWRMKKQLDAAMLQAAWILGPSEVEIDPVVQKMMIPNGFKFLPKQELSKLEKQFYEIKRAAIEKNKLKFNLPQPVETISALISPIDVNASPKWTASVTIISNRLVDFDGEFINDEMANSDKLIETVKYRLDPMTNMRFTPKDIGSYNKNLVKWLMVPKRDLPNQSIQYAMTDGAATKALGIEYIFLKLGKNSQVAVSLNHLKVAQALARSDYLPEGKKQADYLPESVLKPVVASIQPILQTIQFKPGFTLKDATAEDKKTQVNLASLIEGQPTIMEQGIKRIMAEDARKSNFWLFLKDRPRYQGMLLSAFAALFVALKNSAQITATGSATFAARAAKTMRWVMLLIAGALVYINFIVE